MLLASPIFAQISASGAVLGFEPESFKIAVAFEVVEHVDCFKEAWELLKPMG